MKYNFVMDINKAIKICQIERDKISGNEYEWMDERGIAHREHRLKGDYQNAINALEYYEYIYNEIFGNYGLTNIMFRTLAVTRMMKVKETLIPSKSGE